MRDLRRKLLYEIFRELSDIAKKMDEHWLEDLGKHDRSVEGMRLPSSRILDSQCVWGFKSLGGGNFDYLEYD